MERALRAKPWVGLVIAVAVCGLVLPSASVGGATSSGPALVKARYNKKLKRKIVVDTRGRTLYMSRPTRAARRTAPTRSA
jgi:hypothetical protein